MSLRHHLAAAALLAAAAALALGNLGANPYWHDEAPTAVIGHNLLKHGDIVGWDGRNLVGGTNARTLTAELRDPLPPLMYVVTAAGIWLFGYDHFGARVLHALAGLAALALFYLVLVQQLGRHPRLVLVAFALACLSAQLLLYLRQARYFALSLLGVVALFWLYERFWRRRTPGGWAAMTAAASLSFFAHYLICGASVAALAAYHLLLRARATPPVMWALFAASGLITGAVGLAYLAWLGVEGGYLAHTGISPDFDNSPYAPLLRLYVYFQAVFTLDWISWPVGLWFALALWALWRPPSAATGWLARLCPPRLPLAAVGRLVLFGLLLVLAASLLSSQPMKDVWYLAWPRYFFVALPFLLVMKALLVERVWLYSPKIASGLLGVMLLGSVGAYPFNALDQGGGSTLDLQLPRLVQEVVRPRQNGRAILYAALREAAEPDDTVFIEGFNHREVVVAELGDRLLMCCHLAENNAELATRLDAPYLAASTDPDWIILLGGARLPERWDGGYRVFASTYVFAFGLSPELFSHIFAPWGSDLVVFGEPSLLLRRKEAG